MQLVGKRYDNGQPIWVDVHDDSISALGVLPTAERNRLPWLAPGLIALPVVDRPDDITARDFKIMCHDQHPVEIRMQCRNHLCQLDGKIVGGSIFFKGGLFLLSGARWYHKPDKNKHINCFFHAEHNSLFTSFFRVFFHGLYFIHPFVSCSKHFLFTMKRHPL